MENTPNYPRFPWRFVVLALLAAVCHATNVTYNPVTNTWTCADNTTCPGAPQVWAGLLSSTFSAAIGESAGETGPKVALTSNVIQGDVILNEEGSGISDILRFPDEQKCNLFSLCNGSLHYQFFSVPDVPSAQANNVTITEGTLSGGGGGVVYVAGDATSYWGANTYTIHSDEESVPEPATCLMLGTGLLCALAAKRRWA